ncbi:GNAT family N-acetyltransferase [Psychrobacter sp. DM8]|uniref:GNAT family N-acetyltransferase n=1 Tax=Psychrobacter sp. DM8 TaxID=3440636 RepID=UPI003F4FE6E4
MTAKITKTKIKVSKAGISTLTTERLILRQWQAGDYADFAQMNADAEVMKYFPKRLTTAQSDMIAHKCQQIIEDNGWGFWVVSLKQTNKFIGMVGLNQTHANMPFAPSVEIGWRLQKRYWGQGYATEAARAALCFAFDELKFDEVVAFTAVINEHSQMIMKRIGMSNTQDDFYHPMLDSKHSLAKQVLYKIKQEQWSEVQKFA